MVVAAAAKESGGLACFLPSVVVPTSMSPTRVTATPAWPLAVAAAATGAGAGEGEDAATPPTGGAEDGGVRRAAAVGEEGAEIDANRDARARGVALFRASTSPLMAVVAAEVAAVVVAAAAVVVVVEAAPLPLPLALPPPAARAA